MDIQWLPGRNNFGRSHLQLFPFESDDGIRYAPKTEPINERLKTKTDVFAVTQLGIIFRIPQVVGFKRLRNMRFDIEQIETYLIEFSIGQPQLEIDTYVAE
jgi:hypothetical protein